MVLLTAILILFAVICIRKLNSKYALTSLTKRIKTTDGTAIENVVDVVGGFWGSNFDLLRMNLSEQIFEYSRRLAKTFGRSYIQYFLLTPIYNVIDANDAEMVLSDSRLMDKGLLYRFLHPYLKTGLLTSVGKKWHTRRRLLTPTFHFNILKQFVEIFKLESTKFVNDLNRQFETENFSGIISLNELIPRFTLNIICETALGVRLDDRIDGDEYREYYSKIEDILVERLKNPLMAFDCIFFKFESGKNYLKSLEKLHSFSSGIIKKRREMLEEKLQQQEFEVIEITENDNNVYSKQRYAMLDSLLMAEKENLIDHKGICEEVDTFIMAGYDTISVNLIYALRCLALYPDMQQKCYEELQEYISDDLSSLNIKHLYNLKYLDCFIRETLRLYPSVPTLKRECIEDTIIGDKLMLPKRTQINIHVYDIHRNPKYFQDAEKFTPERFMSSEKRHPFAFIPFSAGQRNCIGIFVYTEYQTRKSWHFQLECCYAPIPMYLLK
ncbi:cytochrome P450 4p1-like [Musca autumnalis]|uniref:cytochrome P450 4p1-like n=1 Tax=Musca autumnalis TaxID=221902 RepID=UPI003CF041A9